MNLHTNDPITGAKLNKGLARLNENPDFRQVGAQFVQSPELGAANVILDVQDRFPLRPHFGIDDEAENIFGYTRLRLGMTYGNVFNLDQTLDYEFATDFNFKLIKSHTATYVIPLPWGHTINLMGNYSDLNPDLSKVISSGFTAPSSYWQSGMRYTIPLPSLGARSNTPFPPLRPQMDGQRTALRQPALRPAHPGGRR